MITKSRLYRCRACGNIVEFLHQGEGALSCCGEPLQFFEAGRLEAYRQNRPPLLDLIEVMDQGKSCWQFFESGETPAASAV